MPSIMKEQNTGDQQRLQVRVSAGMKRSLTRAARLRGVPLSDFIVSSAYDAATRTIEEHSVIRLSARDSEAFAMALLNPSTPNDALRNAKERYERLVKR